MNIIIMVGIINLSILIINIVFSRRKQTKSPVVSKQVKIVSKNTKTYSAREHTMMFKNTDKQYYVQFELHNKENIKLCVSQLDYNDMQLNDTGILYIRGNRFIKFEK